MMARMAMMMLSPVKLKFTMAISPVRMSHIASTIKPALLVSLTTTSSRDVPAGLSHTVGPALRFPPGKILASSLEHAQDKEDDQNDQQQPYEAARSPTPSPAVGPHGHRSEQQQNQDYQ
jgi:hypothetical protein